MKISIIIPVYNAEKYLERCLNSIKAQSFSNIEVIMVDDGSTDESGKICKTYSSSDSRFIYLRQENGGVSSARNRGLSVASGDFISFCDSDDWVEPDIYETLYNLIQVNSADIAVCGYSEETAECSAVIESEGSCEILNCEKALEFMFGNINFGGFLWNKLFRKKTIDGFRLDTDICMYEDMVFLCSVFHNSEKIVFQDTKKYHYFINETSATKGKFNSKKWSAQTACNRLLAFTRAEYPNLTRYAESCVLNFNLALADKLAAAKLLNKSNYLRIKKEIKPYASGQSEKLLAKKRKVSLKIFLAGRIFFLIYRKILSVKLFKKILNSLF